jgi:glycosyltransferase involved in cell wall biosynthesis
LTEKLESEIDLSILLPIYGDAPYLEMTLRSIADQENSKFEIVVVLDRPTNLQITKTKKLISNFADVNLLISPSAGISSALNFGLKHSRGTFVARIDSDDEMLSHRLEIQMNVLKMKPGVSCVGTQIIKIDEKSHIVGESNYPESNFWVRRFLRFRNCVAHPATMYKRTDVLSIGGYRQQFDGAEDYDLWLRLLKIGKIINLEQPLTRYRIWDGQNSSDYRKRKQLDAKIVRSFSWIEKKRPDIAKELLKEERSMKNFRLRVQQILKQECPSQWILQEVKHFINLELSFGSGELKIKFILSLVAKTLIFFGKTVLSPISLLEEVE